MKYNYFTSLHQCQGRDEGDDLQPSCHSVWDVLPKMRDLPVNLGVKATDLRIRFYSDVSIEGT